jgi:hypothetical protein
MSVGGGGDFLRPERVADRFQRYHLQEHYYYYVTENDDLTNHRGFQQPPYCILYFKKVVFKTLSLSSLTLIIYRFKSPFPS